MRLNTKQRLYLLNDRGITLIELSLVILLIFTLIALTFMSFTPIKNWQRAKDAGISLQAVYTAQKTFLADHPTSPTNPITVNGVTITEAELQPYLPGSTAGALAPMPTAVDLDGGPLCIDFTVIPPVLRVGVTPGTAPFPDTSGSSTDGLWDIGKH